MTKKNVNAGDNAGDEKIKGVSFLSQPLEIAW
jgi:hypothetical protein